MSAYLAEPCRWIRPGLRPGEMKVVGGGFGLLLGLRGDGAMSCYGSAPWPASGASVVVNTRAKRYVETGLAWGGETPPARRRRRCGSGGDCTIRWLTAVAVERRQIGRGGAAVCPPSYADMGGRIKPQPRSIRARCTRGPSGTVLCGTTNSLAAVARARTPLARTHPLSASLDAR